MSRIAGFLIRQSDVRMFLRDYDRSRENQSININLN